MALKRPGGQLAGLAGLQTGLHVAAGFSRDDRALHQAVALGANHLQIERSGITAFMQGANVPDQVDVAPPVRLVFGLAGSLLASFAIADVNVFDARQ